MSLDLVIECSKPWKEVNALRLRRGENVYDLYRNSAESILLFRRTPTQPIVPPKLMSRSYAENFNFPFCDYTQRLILG